MTYMLSLPVPGTFGVDKGGGVAAGESLAGFLVGACKKTAVGKAFLKSLAQPCLCIVQDADLFVNETTAANDVTTDDVEVLGTTIAANDAIYFGHATRKFEGVDINVTTEGNYTTTTFVAEYWDGAEWTALPGATKYDTVLDGEGTGIVSCTHTIPSDWEVSTFHLAGGTVEGYFIRIRVDGASGGTTTPAQIGQAWVVMDEANAVYTDDTTDINDADDDDVAVVGPSNLKVGDQFIIGHLTQRFAKVAFDLGTALSASITIVWKYWDGDSWAAIPAPITDLTASAGLAFAASAADGLMLSFEPPDDWTATTAANGPGAFGGTGGAIGYFIAAEITAVTSLTTVGTLDQAFVYPLNTGAKGVRVPVAGTITRIDMTATTVSGTTADSRFLLLNATTQEFVEFSWTKGVGIVHASVSLAVNADDELVLVQLTEDGTTEFADGALHLRVAA